ncbi:MAG: hypothetical protein KA763_15095 [Xanthomonadales bacterium]|nr:hypothetical protein [Xanthomonadales bacterium]
MTQQATLRALDAAIMAEFSAAGLADSATFTQSGGGSPTTCSVYIDRGVSFHGFDGTVRNDAVTITAFLSDIADVPKRGALFAVGSDTFKVDAVTSMDESRVVCLVTR